MIAHLEVFLPVIFAIEDSDRYAERISTVDGIEIRWRAPILVPAAATYSPLKEVKLDNKRAHIVNTIRIDFMKNDFERPNLALRDPPEELVRYQVDEYFRALTFVTRSPILQKLRFDECDWLIAYLDDNEKPLPHQNGLTRMHLCEIGRLESAFQYNGISASLWDELCTLPENFQIPPWITLYLHATSAKTNPGVALTLAFASIEVFIEIQLENMARFHSTDPDFWGWITDRGDYRRDPSVSEEFDVLLKYLSGKSLKDEPDLWKAFTELRSGRNSYLHDGVAKIGREIITNYRANSLVEQAKSIIDKVIEWVPSEIRPQQPTLPRMEAHLHYAGSVFRDRANELVPDGLT